MPWNHQGATRTVFMGSKRVYKFPHFTYSWKNFLWGLLANLQEVEFSSVGQPHFCPVTFSLPLGLLVVMPRCETLSRQQWYDFQDHFDNLGFLSNLVERKMNSFGLYDDRIVAVDYGSGKV